MITFQSTTTFIALVLFALVVQVAASPVSPNATPMQFDARHLQDRQTMHRRHGGMAKRVAASGAAGACVLGKWQCVSQDLQRCYDDKWNSVHTCVGDTVCSDGTKTNPPGCVWKDGYGGLASIQVIGAPPVLTTSPPGVSPSTAVIVAAPSPSVSTINPVLYANPSPVPGGSGASTSPAASPLSVPSPSGGVAVPSPSGSTGNTSTTYTPGKFSAPHVVAYVERPPDVTPWPRAKDLLPVNRLLLSFWMTIGGDSGPNLEWSRLPTAWFALSASERQEIVADYHANGIALMLSAFGGTNFPTTLGAEPVATAQAIAKAVKENGFDGVDIDYEDDTAFRSGKSAAWLIALQTELRRQLPPPYLISHAPQPAHFSDFVSYTDRAYAAVHAAVGSGIDWYNMQYYNQGAGNPFTTCASIIDSYNGWAMLEIASSCSMPKEKLVLGKPGVASDANNSGTITGEALGVCMKDMKGKGLVGGMMTWQWGKSYTQAFCKAAMAGYA